MSRRGFTVIELVVALAITLVVAGGVATMTGPLRDLFERSLLASDLDAGGRAVLDAVARDIREAGSGPAIRGPDQHFARVVTAVTLMQDLATPAAGTTGQGVRLLRVPAQAAQAVLAAAASDGATSLLIDTAARCRGGPPACGFAPAMAAVVFDTTHAQLIEVAATGSGLLRVTPPLASGFAAGAIVCELAMVTYGTRALAGGIARLVRVAGGLEQPMIDHVVDFAVTADQEPLHLTRLHLRIRVEAPSPAHRGPAGPLFRRAGSAVNPRRWLVDRELAWTVAIRNPPGLP